MHKAYQLLSILKQGVHIESITAYENNVILGTRSGQLIMYSVNETGKVDMLMFNKNFSKKAIVQMELIAAEHLLFVLTDGLIQVCDISRSDSNFAFIHSSPLTKGCSLFTLDAKPLKSSTADTKTAIKICCAIKRRLQIFYWNSNTICSTDLIIDLKDVPKALCWVNDVVCVGFKDEYVMYNLDSKNLEKYDLIVTSSSHSREPCICVLKNNILGVSKDEYLVAIDPNKYIKKEEKPKTAGSLDVTSASIEVKTPLKPILWSSPLLDLVWDEPFVVGRVSNAIEVRSLEGNGPNKDTLVQIIPDLNSTKFLIRSGQGIIFAAGVSELWCIRLVDIPTQRQQLLQQTKYQLAIDLTNVSDEPSEVKSETFRQIHMRYAKQLFTEKQFAEAMKEFERAAADPFDVIRLFPNLVPDQSNKSKPGYNSNEAAVPAQPTPILEDKDLENAMLALIEFLALARQKQIVKLRDTKSSSKTLMSIIDTTLLKCYLQTNDSLIAPLLRLNQCHFEESEKILRKHGKISELIILYQMNGKHKKALELLQSQASIEGSSLYGHERTIHYLQQLSSAHLPLIFEFSSWVLRQHPDDGLRIFTDDFIEVESLPRAKVLDFLLIHHKALVIPYLEHVINVWKDSNTLIHNVLITQYREKVQHLMEDLKKPGSEEKREITEQLEIYRKKLYEFLTKSDKYSPDVVLKDFPTNILLKERAVVLGRLKKHEKALAIYIQILGDVEAAAQYCEEHFKDNNDIFLTLLNTLLNPLKQPPYDGVELHPDFLKPNQDIILDLLNKYAVNIKLSKVWPYLPGDMPFCKLQNYLETVLRTQMANQHQNQIMLALLSAETLRTKKLIKEQESKSVEITEFSTCPDCKKRFTNQSAFVRYPSGEVVHLSCHDRRAQSASSSSSLKIGAEHVN